MSPLWRPDSVAIDASAGYGKTEILCTRLLATYLAAPDSALRSTVALTFTRAAAGEIYSRMLLMLADALREGGDPAQLTEKFRTLLHTDAFRNVTRDDLRQLLALLIRDMGALGISTIDSFFFRLVRAYSVELGLPGTVELAAENDGAAESEQLTRELFGGSGAAMDELLAACRESRYGNEDKRCFDSCRELLTMTMKFRQHRDDPDFWGGRFGRFVPVPAEKRREALALCEAHVWPEKYRRELSPLLHACARADTAACRFTRGEQQLLRSFLGCIDEFPAVTPSGYKQGWEHTPETVAAMRLLFENGRRVLLCQCAQRTAALRPLLNDYLELYDDRMLRRGRINFADLPMLLAENSVAPGAQEEFLNEIRYRTNSRFTHFLIDEFQDTSRAQWEVLDSIAGDNGDGDHSLFIVGDVKQAIYGWRDGDSKLMGEVASRLENDRLELSFRYGSGICAALNHIFGSSVREMLESPSPAIRDFAPVWERWAEIFHDHRPSPSIPVPGEFEVLALIPGTPDFTAVSARLIAAKLKELDFFGRGLSGGVLVRDKKSGIELRDALLKLHPELADSVVWEGDESIVGDPLVASLVAFGVWLQHPADTLAEGVVRMNKLMRDIVPASAEERMAWKTLIAERGVFGFLRRVLARLNARSVSWGEGPAAGWLPVENGNTDMLLALAARFDAGNGGGDLLRFRDLAAAARKPAAAVAGKLRLLTIHHSKGLTFDVVFHPVFDSGRGIGNWKRPDASGMVTGGAPGAEWLLNRPREEGMREPEIAAAVQAAHTDRCFEELCALYVAMTRARYGMYVYLPPRIRAKCEFYHPDWMSTVKFKGRRSPAEADAAYTISDFIFEACFDDPVLFPVEHPLPVRSLPADPAEGTVGPVGFIRRAFGTPGTPERPPAPPRAVPLRVEFGHGAPRPKRATPSKLDAGRKVYFTLPRADGGELLGTRIHEFFESIGRWSEFTPPPATDPGIMAHYRACAAAPELTELLDEACELWRERPFDVLLRDGNGDSVLVSGCFDRVQLYRDDRGGISRACIIDYKSNQTDAAELPQLVEHYREQLETYRQALAVLLGITPNSIDCRLVFTRLGAVARV